MPVINDTIRNGAVAHYKILALSHIIKFTSEMLNLISDSTQAHTDAHSHIHISLDQKYIITNGPHTFYSVQLDWTP